MTIHQNVNLFVIDEQQYAIQIDNISRVLRAVEITMVPNSPEYMLGLIDYHGKLLPVLNIRHLIGLPSKDVDIDDRFVILEIRNKTFVIVVDGLSEILSVNDEKILIPDPALSDSKIKKVIRLESGIVFLLDFDQLLNHQEIKILEGFINENNVIT